MDKNKIQVIITNKEGERKWELEYDKTIPEDSIMKLVSENIAHLTEPKPESFNWETFLIELGDKENIYWHGMTAHSISHNGDFLNAIIKKIEEIIKEERKKVVGYHKKRETAYSKAIEDILNYLKKD